MDAHHVLQRARHEEVLLLQTQALAGGRLVVRIQHLAQILRVDLALDRAVVIAHVEGLEIERLHRLRAPQPQQLRVAGAEAADRRVVVPPAHDAAGNPAHAVAPVRAGVMLGAAAQLDVERDLRPRDFPRVAVTQPLVGALDLPPVLDALVEYAVLVADTVTDRGDLQSCERFHVARREPSEAAVAQPRLLFLLQQLVEVQPQLAHRLPDRLGDVQVQEIGAEMRAQQELGRQITDGARRANLVGLRGLDPAREQPVAHGIGKRLVVVVFRRDRGEARLDAEEVVEEAALDGLDTEPRARGLRRGRRDLALRYCRHGRPTGYSPYRVQFNVSCTPNADASVNARQNSGCRGSPRAASPGS